jgi:arylsulfatase A-like enzyme
VAALLVGIVGFGVLQRRAALRQGEQIHLWPPGTVDDIATLASRDDLNVLFILIDTLRADRMSAYGYASPTTPMLANLSRVGIRFERNLAQSSWTKSSMASLWTSCYPTRTGVIEYDDVIPSDAVMPAEVFAREGFRTVGLYRNGWVAPIFGFDQGFDVYKKPAMSRAPTAAHLARPTLRQRGTDEEVIKAAREFLRIEGNATQRWFLYLHLMDVHEYTYDEASAVFGSSYSDIYDSAILRTDSLIDVLLGTMIDWGLLRDTIVVIASDHGEAFRERGHEGHARFLYRETTETPLIILLPFRLEAGGIVVRSRSRNVDIFPTLYDVLGIERPADHQATDGVSLLPDILAAGRGLTPVEAREGFAHLVQGWGQRQRAARTPTFSLTSESLRYVHQVVGGQPQEDLFDSRTDPEELDDLSEERPADLDAMRGRARELAQVDPVWGEPEARELNELELNQLRALGYAIE